jgi:hypothetical protein
MEKLLDIVNTTKSDTGFETEIASKSASKSREHPTPREVPKHAHAMHDELPQK